MNLPIILMDVAQQTQKTGFWASFVNFLGSILKGLNSITGVIPAPFGGYGLAIVLFTLLMRLVLLPLDLKSRKANQKMQEIQPLLSEIQKKYKNDPEKLNKKTMELYRKHEVNPLGGCLPMLLQMPLFFALFAALRSISDDPNIAQYAAPFLWIKNIWHPDSPLVNNVGESIALFGPGFNGLFILPLLAGVTSYFQMKMTQPQGGSNQQMKGFATIMPLMSVWFCIMYTASFAIYWVTSNLFQIAQQLIFKKYLAPAAKEGDQE
ncbi:MAG: YidC/Oxa1 family membrane protein insertase [Caldicoprobacterales bacterium]|jgi:YidC/Oxa1 family membrane protein insertase|nr:YidC/Oxa1 family membrane protein insertase [Clostridiales bacterium]